MIPRRGPVRVEFGAPPSGESVARRRAVEVLTVASWLSTAVVVVALLIVQPLLTVALSRRSRCSFTGARRLHGGGRSR